MKLPSSLTALIETLERMPGIGPKTAQRLGFYLLHVPQSELEKMGNAFSQLKKGTVLCGQCHGVSETELCPVCSNPERDSGSLCVVEQPLDMLAIEASGTYRGIYHVLHGAISPLANIGPDQLLLSDLRSKLESGKIREVILATNSTMEGEATAMYIKKLIQPLQETHSFTLTRIGLGLPAGADIEYADEITIARAMSGRASF